MTKDRLRAGAVGGTRAGAVSRYGDNGPWRGRKGSVYEGGVRVPAVVLDRDPGESADLLAARPDVARRLLARLQDFRLELEGIPDFQEGRDGFQPPPEWRIQ